MITRSIRLVLAATLLCLAGPLVQGCGGCSRGGDGASDDDDDDDDDGVTAPVITAVVPSSAKPTVSVSVTGTNFGSTQGTSTLTVGGVAVAPDTWSDTSITFTVPADVPPGDAPVVVTANALASNDGAFRVTLASAAYTHNDDGPLTISGFAIGTDGALTPLAGSPYAPGGGTAGFGGDNSGIAVHPGRRLLFATLNTALAVYSIDGVTGALTQVAGSPFATGTDQNYGVVTTPDGAYVYVAGYAASLIAGFSVAADGTLTALAGSPFPGGRIDGNPDGLLMHPGGSWLLANQESAQGIDVWSVEADGTLMVVGTNVHAALAQSVYALEWHPARDHVYTAGDAGGVAGYAFDPLDGSLATLPGSPWIASGASSPAITPDGTRLYVGTQQGSDIYGFTIAGDGSLTNIVGSPFASGQASPLMLDIGMNGFLVAADEGASRINVYEIQTAGTILLVSSAALPASADASDLLVTP